MQGQTLHIYCDESYSDKGHAYMVMAGLIAAASDAAQYRKEIMAWRDERNMHSEMKWTKVSRNKIVEYTDYATFALEKIKRGGLKFFAIVLEKRFIDYRKHHDGDEELGFYKFLYQLLYHGFCKRLKLGDKVFIFVDERNTRYEFNGLQRALNHNLCREGLFENPVKQVTPINSKASELMQMNDVLMGACGFHWNGRHELPGTDPAKTTLAAHIAASLKTPTLAAPISCCMGRFGIWKFRLQQ